MNTLETHVDSQRVIPKDKPVVLALSGGIDSTVLFHVLKTLGHRLVVAHVNHQQRPESDDEMHAIKRLCASHKVPCDTLVLQDADAGNFQHIARQKRRAFFVSVAKKHGSDTVALAHHLNDQAETLVMRFIKGYRLASLSAMARVSRHDGIRFVRPFLDIPKQQLIDYATEHGLRSFEDSTNTQTHYTRNRVRHQLMPVLLEENPNFLEAAKQHTQRFEALGDLLSERTDAFLSRFHTRYDLSAFLRETSLVRHDIIKTLIEPYKPYPSTDVVEALIDLLTRNDPNATYPLDDDHHFIKAYDVFYIDTTEASPTLNVCVDKEGLVDLGPHGTYLVTQEILDHKHTNYCAICYNEKVFPLYFRTRRNGDRIRLSVGTKKVKSIFIDHKVPRVDRDAVLLLANREEVLWIPFLKMSAKVSRDQQHTLYVYEVRPCSKKTSKTF